MKGFNMDLKTARKLLANQSKEGLLRIIVSLSESSDEAEEWLLDYCEKHGEVNEAELLARKQVEHYWNAAEEMIDEANCYGGTSEDEADEVDAALCTIRELAKKHSFSWDFRQSLIDRMLEQADRNNSGFEDALIDACMDLCRTEKEFLYLADRLRDASSAYYRRFAAALFLKYGDEDSFVEIQSQNLEYGSDYIALADFYMKKGQRDKAIRLVETAAQKVDSRLDEVYEWLYKVYRRENQEEKLIHLYENAQSKRWNLDTMTRLMVEYYADDYEKKRPYLLRMPEVCGNGETKEWLDTCRRELTPEDFDKASGRLYALLKKKAPTDYLQLRIDEGCFDEVLEYLREHPNKPGSYWEVDQGHKLSKQLASRYPEEVCRLYWRECEGLCTMTNKKYYAQAVSILKEIRRICSRSHLETAWQTAYASFLERHKRKRNLMGLIAGEKGLA